MWVEQLDNGKYRYAERYKDPYTLKDRKVSVVLEKNTASAKKEAAYILQKKIDKICLQVGQKDEKLTFAGLIDLYAKGIKGIVEESTYKRNMSCAHTLIRLIGADTLVSQLNAPFCRERLLFDNCEHGTYNERLARFKAIIRWAYKAEVIDDIRYLDKLEKLKDQKKKDKLGVKYFEKDDLTNFLNNLKVEKWKELSKFLVLSGLRVGEALALTLDDINIEEKMINVDKTFDYNNNITTSPKTEASNRDVFMQQELLTLTVKLRKNALANRLRYGHKSNLLFANENGNHYSVDAFNKYLRENGLAMGYGRVTSHWFRHTHASLLAEAGLSLEAIQRRLGHDNSKVTKDVYIHVTEKVKEKDNAAIAKISLFNAQ